MPLNDKSPTVLVVDDAEVNVMILEEILQDDYHVITANNGKNALEALRKASVLPKLILLDVVMPEMNGREMFDILKADATFKRIPVIFITAENDSESELLAAGAVDFINKPFTPEIVKLRVRNQIELKNYSDSLEEMVAEKTAEATKTLDNALQGLANVIEHRDLESASTSRGPSSMWAPSSATLLIPIPSMPRNSRAFSPISSLSPWPSTMSARLPSPTAYSSSPAALIRKNTRS
ncbi:response regulator [Leadbettera azotonutricia]|uniref:response regulator n=1 Tax=Leadbettera azotonutricia TaxID=150829 RepID=UPI0002D8C379|nr:response regulator [Leadbettera azotonutricia]